jgi:superfamily II RNA helicase
MIEIKKDIKKIEDELSLLTISNEEVKEIMYEESLKNNLKNSSNAVRRKLQSEYESWKNKHQDRIWNPIKEQYKKFIKLNYEMKSANEDLKYYSNFESSLEPYFEILKELNYMSEDRSLTKKGVNATEVNEANCLILSYAYEEKMFDSLEQKDILMVLSCFLESDSKENITLKTVNIKENIYSVLHSCEKYCKLIEGLENKYKISFNQWTLNYEYIEMLGDLFKGLSVGEVCFNYSVMEGNLTRFLLKLVNIVDELKNIATLNRDVSLLEKLENVQAYDFYKIAIPESLYLHI